MFASVKDPKNSSGLLKPWDNIRSSQSDIVPVNVSVRVKVHGLVTGRRSAQKDAQREASLHVAGATALGPVNGIPIT